MSHHTVLYSAPSPRWPSASAAAARVEMVVVPWTIPMPVTSIAVRAPEITAAAQTDRSNPVAAHRHVTSQLCARPQSP